MQTIEEVINKLSSEEQKRILVTLYQTSPVIPEELEANISKKHSTNVDLTEALVTKVNENNGKNYAFVYTLFYAFNKKFGVSLTDTPIFEDICIKYGYSNDFSNFDKAREDVIELFFNEDLKYSIIEEVINSIYSYEEEEMTDEEVNSLAERYYAELLLHLMYYTERPFGYKDVLTFIK